MAKQTNKERVNAWDQRLSRANKENDEWEQEFSCEMLYAYYLGKQQKDVDQTTWDNRKYVINMFYPSINISKPSLLFTIPKYHVTPRPTRLNDPLSDVEARAKLQEDTLQTEVDKPRLGFAVETGLAILDAQFRFGVVQIGYTADYADNPNADKPILIDGEIDQLNEVGNTSKVKGKVPLKDSNGEVVNEAKVKLKSESLYMQWIPAKDFRVSTNGGNRLHTHDWCGYFKWMTIEDVKRNPRYKNTGDLKASGKLKGSDLDRANSIEDPSREGMVKVWFIWDIRAKTRYVFENGGKNFFLEEDFTFLPFAVLKFDERLGKFLPLPPSFNWVHPQNELNDTREMQRIHRKRAKRRYLRRPSVTADEFQKFEDGEDMVCIMASDPSSDVMPVQDAPLDPSIMQNLPVSHEDFTRISGISGESQQVAQSETATQANLIAVMGQTRESSKRLLVAEWLSEIGRIMLMTMKDMALPVWIKSAVDPESPSAALEAQEVKKLWKEIDVEKLGDIDNDIRVDIQSMSPVAREQERQNFINFLSLFNNPVLSGILSQSPYLLRKAAGYFDIQNERELQEISKAMAAAAMMAAQAQAAKQGVALPGAPQPGPTPTNQGIQDQLMQQVPQGLTQ